MLTLFQMVGAGFFFVQFLMVALWVVYYIQRNAGIVDVGWAICFPLLTLTYFFLGQGGGVKSLLLLLMVLIWASRLTFYLYRRYLTTPEDARYREIRESWGEEHSDLKFLVLFTFQGLVAIALSLPMILVNCCSSSTWLGWEFLGMIVWGIGVAGEYLADEQLRRFKARGERSAICTEGVWKYTRHPNYFFEWLVWVGYALFAFSSPGGIFAFLSPLLMYYLLRYVSGVPMVEAHLLQLKGEPYKRYQASTSEFFPWFPKDVE